MSGAVYVSTCSACSRTSRTNMHNHIWVFNFAYFV